MQRRSLIRSSASLALGLGALSRVRSIWATTPAPSTPFAALRDEFFLAALTHAPVTATYLGGSSYDPSLAGIDGRLRDFSDATLRAERDLNRGFLKRLGQINPAPLSAAERIDHAVLGAQLGFLVHQYEDIRSHERVIDSYVAEPFRGVDWQIQGMTETGGTTRGTEAEWALVLQRVKAVPEYLARARTNLLAGKSSGNMPDHRMVERDGIKGSRDNADYFRNSMLASAKGFLGTRSFAARSLTDLNTAGEIAAKAWLDFSTWLETTFANDAKDRFSVGEAEYQWRTSKCLREPRSAAQLYQYGAEQVSRYEEQIFSVAGVVSQQAKLGLKFTTDADKRDSVRAVMAFLSKESPKNDDELLAWYISAGERAVAYGRERGLFDVPAQYRLEVTPTPPVLQSTIDAAYYPAPPFKKSGVGRFYLTPTGNDPAALKLNNKSSVADTAVHEGFPGHDWYYKYQTAHGAEISNIRWFTPGAVEDSSAMWEDSMAAEGWALYSEELMAEPATGKPYGFYTAGERLYELQGQLLRAVRVRVDTGIHTGRMSFNDAMDYFLEHASFAPGARTKSDPESKAQTDGALRAIYRYSKWPTQAITYNLGKESIIALRDDWKKQKGSAYSAKDFHERFMRMGTIPTGYFRETFLKG
ncbi:MAG: DUF885 domain-containing protein [Gemmatimonadota bacterium]